MRLAKHCKVSKTCSTLIWQQPRLLTAQERQRGQVSILIPALDRVKQLPYDAPAAGARLPERILNSPLYFHSCLSTVSGSIFVPRRAGK